MSISDKEFFQLSIAISKALNPMETPLKLKHARSAIICTHRTKEAKSFWAVVSKQQLMENRFTAWKCCHLLHKVLREGHSSAIKHSQSHKKMIHEMGKLWGHLQDGVGICIQAYTRLLVTKLEFHEKNPNFSGNLVIDFSDLERVAGDDINFYFQLGVEIFDYLDDILALQAKVFNSINTYRMSSMTPQGQCRLAPLIPLIQDSNPLYDLSVRVMFKLHANLPNDILVGHRDRFRTVFNQLVTFYDAVRPLQYFADLIQVPHLPKNAPNFTSSVDFGSYIPPVVVVPPEPEPVVESLVDVSEEQMQNNRQDTPEPVPQDLERLLRERDDFIRELQFEIERLRTLQKSMTITQRDELNNLEEQISKLNSQLAIANEELENMRILKDDLELQVQYTPSLKQKATAEEERANATEDKFNKLKNMYTQIRDEHINLLRQRADETKLLNSLKKQNAELTAEKYLIKEQLDELAEKQIENQNILTKTLELESQEQLLNLKYTKLVEDHDTLQNHYDDLQADKSAEISELKAKSNELENKMIEQESETSASIELIRNELVSKTTEHAILCKQFEKSLDEKHQEIINLQENIITLTQSSDTLKNEIEVLTSLNDEIKLSQQQSEIDYKQNLIELEKQNNELQTKISFENIQYEENLREAKHQFSQDLNQKNAEITRLENEILKKDEEYKTINCILERLSDEKTTLECDIQDLLHQQAELDDKYKISLDKIAALETSLHSSKIHAESCMRALLEACIKSSQKLTIRASTENDFSNVTGTTAYFMMIAEELQNTLNELQIVYKNYSADNTVVEGFARKIVLTGHLLSIIQIQGMAVCNTSADIDAGEKIADEVKNINTDINLMFRVLLELADPSVVLPIVVNLKEKLIILTSMIHVLSKKVDDSEQLGDLVESELATMDKAIEEAASKIVELLSNSRASDSGIKLEVNERILDACTSLMQCIRVLVLKSKALQTEIVSIGKGTASVKEFYKRNNQWTEGLISAAKSVATGANLLVEAANKAVSGEAKHHLDIIVAAQEIAACTAQLVVSSRVKAPRNSQNLTELSLASRNVTQATGAVVATAKDCSQHLEDYQELDLTKLTVHQAKTLEMEIQVKVLELEQSLQSERQRLAAFRRNNYRSE